MQHVKEQTRTACVHANTILLKNIKEIVSGVHSSNPCLPPFKRSLGLSRTHIKGNQFMENPNQKRRHELEKYFDAKGPFAFLRLAQMKRAWRQSNRRELTWWENTYIPSVVSGIWITSKHFFRNLTFHILHLFGLCKDIPAAVTYQYPEHPRTLATRTRTRHRNTSPGWKPS